MVKEYKLEGICTICNKSAATRLVEDSTAGLAGVCNSCLRYSNRTVAKCQLCDRVWNEFVKDGKRIICTNCFRRSMRRCKRCGDKFIFYVKEDIRRSNRYIPPSLCSACKRMKQIEAEKSRKKEQENLLKYQKELKDKKNQMEKERITRELTEKADNSQTKTTIKREATGNFNIPPYVKKFMCESCGQQIIDGKCGCYY